MLQFKAVKELQDVISNYKSQGKSIGFVPTMGALHKGHLSLIEHCKKTVDIAVCSIFVNPTQFNDPKDLEKYPRTISKDTELLEKVGNDIVFIPTVEEVYPENLDTSLELDFGKLANVMEGAFRPGHFDGMAQVVNRLLEIVLPDYLFMGQKDYQQFAIVQDMLRQLKSPIQLVMGATIREEDGLAMSSRNVRLTPEERQKAVLISKTLKTAMQELNQLPPLQVRERSLQRLNIPEFKVDYFEIVDGISLQPVESIINSKTVVACTAVYLGAVRLIDNMIYEINP